MSSPPTISFEIALPNPPQLGKRKRPIQHGSLPPLLLFWQVNFKVKRSNWDGTGDEQKDAEEKKQDEEVIQKLTFRREP